MNKEQKEILELWGKLSLDRKRELIDVFLQDFPGKFFSAEQQRAMLDQFNEQAHRYQQSQIDKKLAETDGQLAIAEKELEDLRRDNVLLEVLLTGDEIDERLEEAESRDYGRDRWVLPGLLETFHNMVKERWDDAVYYAFPFAVLQAREQLAETKEPSTDQIRYPGKSKEMLSLPLYLYYLWIFEEESKKE